MPYTVHLNAVIAMVMSWANLDTPMAPDIQEFMSLLGFLDLQTHTINRATPQNHIWYKYCRGQEGVDGTSGLPYSLLDLLSAVHTTGIEHAFLSWVEPAGAPAQQCVWKATRFAGILSAYKVQQEQASSGVAILATDSPILPGVLVNNILTLIQQCLVFVPSQTSHFKQTLMYPLVMAAAQRSVLSASSKTFICQTIGDLASERNHVLYRGVLRVIREYWQSEEETIECTARRLNIELCLL